MTDNDAPPLTSRRALTDEQLLAVGCLVYEAARLESLFAEMARNRFSPIVADALFTKLTIGSKLEKIKAVLPAFTSDKAAQDELLALLADLGPDLQKRNAIVHGAWDEPEPVVNWWLYFHQYSTDRNASTTGNGKTIKASEVMSLAYRFADSHRRLENWISRLPAPPAT